MQVARRAKNFKDIKRNTQQRDSNKENYSTVNADSPLIGTLSFKKLDTQRLYQQFVSPPKQLVITTRPIETINLSNKKKEAPLQFRQPLHHDPEGIRGKESQRNVSTNSNRSNTSEKQGMFKRFSQLAECTSREKDTTKSNPMCFNRMVSQRESEAAKLYQLQIPPTSSEQNLMKKQTLKVEQTERLSYKPKTAKQKVGEHFLRPSTVKMSSPKATAVPKLKESLQSDFDQVNMSRQSVEGLDMSPYFF